jgi:hypothetical protein
MKLKTKRNFTKQWFSPKEIENRKKPFVGEALCKGNAVHNDPYIS